MYVALFACLKIKILNLKILNNVKFHYFKMMFPLSVLSNIGHKTQEAMWLNLCFVVQEVVVGSLLKSLR